MTICCYMKPHLDFVIPNFLQMFQQTIFSREVRWFLKAKSWGFRFRCRELRVGNNKHAISMWASRFSQGKPGGFGLLLLYFVEFVFQQNIWRSTDRLLRGPGEPRKSPPESMSTGYIYWRLLATNPEATKRILGPKNWRAESSDKKM